jgi:hypothetical protein
MKMVALILVLLFATPALSQDVGRVKSDKPTVYLEYLCQDKKNVYLRMYNNTAWNISVTADELYPSKHQIKLQNGVNTYAAPNGKAISLHYRVGKWASPRENVKVPKVAYPDNGFSNWIASQDSILFLVPIEYLRKDLQVYVRFNYEWEVTRQGYTINDPEHRVSFRGIDLSNTKPCK